jgi:hypothetical protein
MGCSYEPIREMGYGGKYTQVKDAVRELLRVKREFSSR